MLKRPQMLRWLSLLRPNRVRPNRDPDDRSVHAPFWGRERRSSWGLPPFFCRWAIKLSE